MRLPIITVIVLLATGAWAQTVKTLYMFTGHADGNEPWASLIFDATGNLYGTTFKGGAGRAGTVFELSPNADGSWSESVLYNFCPDQRHCSGGTAPFAGLISDAAGNLYGAAYDGGTGSGTVFELSPQTGGGWTESVLLTFAPLEGRFPAASLIFDKVGNLYGTTVSGGPGNCDGRNSCGVVFELTPEAGGRWTEKVLHGFNGTDGYWPSGLIFDATGNLYGTTFEGGAYGQGTVFELRPEAGGRWTEKVLHSFATTGTGGYYPGASLIFDAAENRGPGPAPSEIRAGGRMRC